MESIPSNAWKLQALAVSLAAGMIPFLAGPVIAQHAEDTGADTASSPESPAPPRDTSPSGRGSDTPRNTPVDKVIASVTTKPVSAPKPIPPATLPPRPTTPTNPLPTTQPAPELTAPGPTTPTRPATPADKPVDIFAPDLAPQPGTHPQGPATTLPGSDMPAPDVDTDPSAPTTPAPSPSDNGQTDQPDTQPGDLPSVTGEPGVPTPSPTPRPDQSQVHEPGRGPNAPSDNPSAPESLPPQEAPSSRVQPSRDDEPTKPQHREEHDQSGKPDEPKPVTPSPSPTPPPLSSLTGTPQPQPDHHAPSPDSTPTPTASPVATPKPTPDSPSAPSRPSQSQHGGSGVASSGSPSSSSQSERPATSVHKPNKPQASTVISAVVPSPEPSVTEHGSTSTAQPGAMSSNTGSVVLPVSPPAQSTHTSEDESTFSVRHPALLALTITHPSTAAHGQGATVMPASVYSTTNPPQPTAGKVDHEHAQLVKSRQQPITTSRISQWLDAVQSDLNRRAAGKQVTHTVWAEDSGEQPELGRAWTIKAGDTAWSLARALWGEDVPWSVMESTWITLVAWNPSLADALPHRLPEGVTIIIPADIPTPVDA